MFIQYNELCWHENIATFFFFFCHWDLKKKKTVCRDYNMNKTNWNANHVQNWFGLVFLDETCFNSFGHDMGASSLALSFSNVLSLYKRHSIRWLGGIVSIIYSKTCLHFHLNNTLLYSRVKPHPYQDILHLIILSLKTPPILRRSGSH